MSTPHPPELDAAWALVAAEPIARLRFTLAGADPVNVTPLVGSELDWDASRWPRCTLTARMPTTITPTALPPALSPYGGRVTVTVGAKWRGREHVFTAATLDVARVVVDRPDAGVTIECASFESRVNEDPPDAPLSTTAGLVSVVVRGLVQRTLGPVALVNLLGSLDVALTAGAYLLDGDVWPVIEQIATDHGAEAWFDAAGALVLSPAPTVGASVLTIATGKALTGYSSVRQWAPNRVALVYEDSSVDPPTRRVGVWEDTRTDSALKVSGPYGRHTNRDTIDVEPGKLPTQAKADAAALGLARRVTGLARNIQIRSVPAPWLLPGDTITVGMAGGLTENHVVQSVTHPLPALDVMQIGTRDSTYTGGPF